MKYDIFRIVGTESQRTYSDKCTNGFFDKYMRGAGLDIGYAGYTSGRLPILDSATGVDTNYPSYDGLNLPFNSNSQDYVYSSHCLEHIEHWEVALMEWHRVLKIGGFMIIIVPHLMLYEKKYIPPSNWNEDHKRFYTPASLLSEVEGVLADNSYRVRLLEDGDKGFDYSIGPDIHSNGQYEITLVLEKIKTPTWRLD